MSFIYFLFSDRGTCLVIKNLDVLNANYSQHLNRVKLNCFGFSHLQYVLQRLLQVYFQFQDISLCQAWVQIQGR